MIDIKLYNCAADNRVVDKTDAITLVFDEHNCVLKKGTSIMDITLEFIVADMHEMASVNYVFIPSLNTYYFVTDVDFVAGNKAVVSCRTDVLMTYKDIIKNLTAHVVRSESHSNGWLPDNKYPLLSKHKIITRQFPTAIDNDSICLITVG